LRRSESATLSDRLYETCRSTSYRPKNRQAVPEWLQRLLLQGSSQRLQQDLLRQLLPDWLRRPALLVGLLLEVVLPLRVLPAAAVAARAPGLWQAVAVPRLLGSSAPEHLDSYLQLRAALVPEAEPALAKPTRTRL